MKKNKKNDLLLLGTVLAAAVLIWVFRAAVGGEDPGYLSVSIDGEEVQTFELTEEKEAELNGGTNVIRIKDGVVSMVRADCPDQLCVHQRAISKNNESIICLPNKLVLQIVSRDEAELDAVTN